MTIARTGHEMKLLCFDDPRLIKLTSDRPPRDQPPYSYDMICRIWETFFILLTKGKLIVYCFNAVLGALITLQFPNISFICLRSVRIKPGNIKLDLDFTLTYLYFPLTTSTE